MSHARYAKILLTSLLVIAIAGLMLYSIIVGVAGLAHSEDQVNPDVEITQLAKGVVQYRTQKGDEVCYTVVGKLHGWTVTNSCFQRQMTMEDFQGWLK